MSNPWRRVAPHLTYNGLDGGSWKTYQRMGFRAGRVVCGLTLRNYGGNQESDFAFCFCILILAHWGHCHFRWR